MSYKTILVRAEPDEKSDAPIKLAMTVADMFDAAILGVCAEAFDAVNYGYLEGELIAAARDQIDIDLTDARTRFKALTKDSAIRTDWIAGEGYPLDVVARVARGADLIVARRPSPHAGAAASCTATDLLTATGLPLLLACDSGAPLTGRRILVAWRDRREANRAITDAMPFLMRADAVQVVNVCAAGEGDEVGLGEVERRLARHGVAVEAKSVSPDHHGVTHAIEGAAEAFGADLIVAGAYSHSRLREWVLGGVTQDLLAASRRHLLLSH